MHKRRAPTLTCCRTGDEAQHYLDERPELVGQLGSADLLTRDEAADLYPLHLSADTEEEQMVFVDEMRCVGCRQKR